MSLSSPSAESKKLLARAKSGEVDARDAVAREYRQAAYLFALHLVGNPDDALDIAQEAMLRFFTSLHRFQQDRSVRPWLFAIVRNCTRDFWRRSKIRRHEPLDEAVPNLARALTDPRADPEQDALVEERRQAIWQAISRLSTAKREILVLRDFHDLSYAEIAEVLKIPIGTVMSRLHSARKSLQQDLLDNRALEGSRSGP